jgi:hypothetical protein
MPPAMPTRNKKKAEQKEHKDAASRKKFLGIETLPKAKPMA